MVVAYGVGPWKRSIPRRLAPDGTCTPDRPPRRPPGGPPAAPRCQYLPGTGCRARGTLEPIPIENTHIFVLSWKKNVESVISDFGVCENNAHLSGGRTCCFPFSLRSSPRSPRTQCWAMKTRCRRCEINAHFCSRRDSAVSRVARATQHCIRGARGAGA